MMRRRRWAGWFVWSLLVAACGGSEPPAGQSVRSVELSVDVTSSRQTLVGFGVDGQPRNWGSAGVAVAPALQRLVDEAGASMWRVEIDRGLSDWEQDNDDADPNHFNWDAYDRVFSSDPQFVKFWAYVRELNALGVDDIVFAAHGHAPEWMGGSIVAPESYDEFVESAVAFLIFATERIAGPKPRFRWFSPFNEVDQGGSTEGIGLDPESAAALTARLAARLEAEVAAHPQLAAVRLVVPEATWAVGTAPGDDDNYRGRISADPASLAWIDAFAHHSYPPAGDVDYTGATPPEWLSETNGFTGEDGTCGATTWEDALVLYDGTLDALRAGVEAVMVWTDYDAPHVHQNDEWQTYGLLATSLPGIDPCAAYRGGEVPGDELLDQASYAPKATYHAFRHLAAEVPPGSTVVLTDTDVDDLDSIAFLTPAGGLVVTGHNRSARTLEITMTITPGLNPPAAGSISTADAVWVPATIATFDPSTLTLTVPPHSLFTVWPSRADA